MIVEAVVLMFLLYCQWFSELIACYFSFGMVYIQFFIEFCAIDTRRS